MEKDKTCESCRSCKKSFPLNTAKDSHLTFTLEDRYFRFCKKCWGQFNLVWELSHYGKLEVGAITKRKGEEK